MALISSFSVHRAGHLIGIVWLNFLSENRNYLVVDALNLRATQQSIGRFLHAFYFDFTCTCIYIFSRRKVNCQLNGESNILLSLEAKILKNEASRSVEISSAQYSH